MKLGKDLRYNSLVAINGSLSEMSHDEVLLFHFNRRMLMRSSHLWWCHLLWDILKGFFTKRPFYIYISSTNIWPSASCSSCPLSTFHPSLLWSDLFTRELLMWVTWSRFCSVHPILILLDSVWKLDRYWDARYPSVCVCVCVWIIWHPDFYFLLHAESIWSRRPTRNSVASFAVSMWLSLYSFIRLLKRLKHQLLWHIQLPDFHHFQHIFLFSYRLKRQMSPVLIFHWSTFSFDAAHSTFLFFLSGVAFTFHRDLVLIMRESDHISCLKMMTILPGLDYVLDSSLLPNCIHFSNFLSCFLGLMQASNLDLLKKLFLLHDRSVCLLTWLFKNQLGLNQ